jgi:uncharacterized membrane protein
MTRLEFAGLLRGELRGLDSSEVERSVQFYDELISDHMDEGMTEEEAISAVGAPAEIAREILMDMPVAALVRRRVKRRARLKGFAAVLIILGLPVWLPILVAVVAVFVVIVLLAYLVVFILDASLWASVLAVAAAAAVAVMGISLTAGGLLSAGLALGGAGLAVLLALGVIEATKWCVFAWRAMARAIKCLAVGRRNRYEQ